MRGKGTSWKNEEYISVVEVIFALSLSTSTTANSLVDDDDDGPLLTSLESQAEMLISSNSVTRAATMRLSRYCGTEGRSERVDNYPKTT